MIINKKALFNNLNTLRQINKFLKILPQFIFSNFQKDKKTSKFGWKISLSINLTR